MKPELERSFDEFVFHVLLIRLFPLNLHIWCNLFHFGQHTFPIQFLALTTTLAIQWIYWIRWKQKQFQNQYWLSHLLPIHILSFHFFILFNSTCSLVFTTLQSGFSSSKSSPGWICITTASVGRFIAITFDFTVLAGVVCSMFCGSLYLHAVNWQQILYRSRSSSYRCVLHSHSQYYLVICMSPLMRIFLECS